MVFGLGKKKKNKTTKDDSNSKEVMKDTSISAETKKDISTGKEKKKKEKKSKNLIAIIEDNKSNICSFCKQQNDGCFALQCHHEICLNCAHDTLRENRKNHRKYFIDCKSIGCGEKSIIPDQKLDYILGLKEYETTNQLHTSPVKKIESQLSINIEKQEISNEKRIKNPIQSSKINSVYVIPTLHLSQESLEEEVYKPRYISPKKLKLQAVNDLEIPEDINGKRIKVPLNLSKKKKLDVAYSNNSSISQHNHKSQEEEKFHQTTESNNLGLGLSGSNSVNDDYSSSNFTEVKEETYSNLTECTPKYNTTLNKTKPYHASKSYHSKKNSETIIDILEKQSVRIRGLSNSPPTEDPKININLDSQMPMESELKRLELEKKLQQLELEKTRLTTKLAESPKKKNKTIQIKGELVKREMSPQN